MFCQKCGGEILDEAVICIHCGCAVAGRSIEKKKKSKVNVINIVQLVLALICGVCFFLPDGFIRHLYEVGMPSGNKEVSILVASNTWSNLEDFGIALLIVLCAYFVYRIIALCIRPANQKQIRVASLITSSVVLLLSTIFIFLVDTQVYETTTRINYGYGYNSDYLSIPVEYRYEISIMAVIFLAVLVAMVVLDIVNLIKSKNPR